MFHTSNTLSPPATADRSAAVELYMSLELSPSKWLVTSLLSGSGRISKHILRGGDCDALLRLIAGLKAKAQRQAGTTVSIVAIPGSGAGRLLAAPPAGGRGHRELGGRSCLGRRLPA